MKKIINIIVGIALCISVCGNIYLIKLMEETKGQVEVYSSKVVAADDQIVGLQEKVAELERQVTDKEEEIKKLEDMGEVLDDLTPTPTEVTDPQDDIGNGAGQQLTESENTYLEEAKDLWAQNKDSFECNEDTFIESYVSIRSNGSDSDQAYAETLELYIKEDPKPAQDINNQPEVVQTPAPTEQPQQSNSNNNQTPTQPSNGTMPVGPNGPGGFGGSMGTGTGDGASAGRTGGLE